MTMSKKDKIELTAETAETLRMYLKLTQAYRKTEILTYTELKKEKTATGNMKYPQAVALAQWWEEADRTLNKIAEMLKNTV